MNQNELKHYGVLGMKWGVIRSEQPGQKKIAEYDTTRDIINKGDTVYRISGSKHEQDIGRTFIFANQTDADKYAKKVKELEPRSKVYKLSLKVKDVLVGPSEKERVDTFLDRYKQKSVAEVVDYVKNLAEDQGIHVTDKDDETLTKYRAYTVAVAKNVDNLGTYVNSRDKQKFSMRRDDYMRGFTKLNETDQSEIDNLDSAYLIFSRGDTLKTIKSEEVKAEKTAKHSANDQTDLYPNSSFGRLNRKDIFGRNR